MPTRCVAAGCSKTTGDGVSLHAFPSDSKYRWIWTDKVKLTRPKWSGPTKFSALCSEHFDSTSYEVGMYSSFGMEVKQMLKPGAIPTKFPLQSEYQAKKTKPVKLPDPISRGALAEKKKIRLGVCSVPNCKRTGQDRVTMHSFPWDPVQQKAWQSHLEAGTGVPWSQPLILSLVCSDHFQPSCYCEGVHTKGLILKGGSLPTIFTNKQQNVTEDQPETVSSQRIYEAVHSPVLPVNRNQTNGSTASSKAPIAVPISVNNKRNDENRKENIQASTEAVNVNKSGKSKNNTIPSRLGVCSVPNCKRTGQDRVMMHSFPWDPAQQKAWQSHLEAGTGVPWSQRLNVSLVCSDHFQPSCYCEGVHTKGLILKGGSLPTIFTNKQQNVMEDQPETVSSQRIYEAVHSSVSPVNRNQTSSSTASSNKLIAVPVSVNNKPNDENRKENIQDTTIKRQIFTLKKILEPGIYSVPLGNSILRVRALPDKPSEKCKGVSVRQLLKQSQPKEDIASSSLVMMPDVTKSVSVRQLLKQAQPKENVADSSSKMMPKMLKSTSTSDKVEQQQSQPKEDIVISSWVTEMPKMGEKTNEEVDLQKMWVQHYDDDLTSEDEGHESGDDDSDGIKDFRPEASSEMTLSVKEEVEEEEEEEEVDDCLEMKDHSSDSDFIPDVKIHVSKKKNLRRLSLRPRRSCRGMPTTDPQDKSHPATDPQDGTQSATDPQDKSQSATDPQDRTQSATEPQDGTQSATDPRDVTQSSSDPRDGTQSSTDPQDGQQSEPEDGEESETVLSSSEDSYTEEYSDEELEIKKRKRSSKKTYKAYVPNFVRFSKLPTRYKCKTCQEHFPEAEELRSHFLDHHPNVPLETADLDKQLRDFTYPVPVCVANYFKEIAINLKWCKRCNEYVENIASHEKSHVVRRDVPCKVCGKLYSKSGLAAHEASHHRKRKPQNKPDGTRPQCPQCHKTFATVSSLKHHQSEVHVIGKRICEQCGKKVGRGSALAVHKLIHLKEKPFVCPECGRGFSQKSNMNLHMRVHTGVKPYKCNICQQAFNHNISLKTHQKKKHGLDWWKQNQS